MHNVGAPRELRESWLEAATCGVCGLWVEVQMCLRHKNCICRGGNTCMVR